MKICIIANGYPNDKDPQWGCFERDQALALKNIGHEVDILYLDCRFRQQWRKIGFSKIEENGVYIYSKFVMPTAWIGFFSGKLQFLIESKIACSLFKEYIKDTGCPDVIYAQFLWNIAYATFFKEKYGIPLVGIEHWSGMTKKSLQSLALYQGNLAYRKADKLLSVSESLQTHVYRHFNIKTDVVYNMLGQEFVSSELRENKKNESFRFIAVGSLIPRKGFDILIEAFFKSKLKEKGCSITIIGNGPEMKNLQIKIRQLGISDSINLIGKRTKNEIISEMNNSHVFVLSSRAETFGVVCIEALSQGLPNIATICGGPEEFINEDNGIIVPPEDVKALSDAMINMYNNYSKYDRRNIAKECRRKFAPQVIAQQLTDIFETVLNS